MDTEQLGGWLERIARSRTSLDDDRESIIEAFGDQSAGPLEELDFEEAATRFDDWLMAVIDTDPPPPDLVTLRVGLVDEGDQFTLYLSGSKEDSRRQSAWAAHRDWQPNAPEPPIELLFPIWSEWPAGETTSWAPVQAVVLAIVKAFFARAAARFSARSALSRLHVVCGFDDGDWFEVGTPLGAGAADPVVVFEAEDQAVLALAISILDDAGIYVAVGNPRGGSDDLGVRTVVSRSGPFSSVATLRVGADDEERARELLAGLASGAQVVELPADEDER